MRPLIHPIATPFFQQDGRGPILSRWLRDSDLFLLDTWDDPAPLVGDIVGAEYILPPSAPHGGPAWVVFHGLQVLQIVPEEVHSYWHRSHLPRQSDQVAVWRVEHSLWMAGFDPRHLAGHQHFVLEWYDTVAEVICRELIFGSGAFDLRVQLAQDGRFAGAYLRHAETAERRGHLAEAITDLQQYIAIATDPSAVAYAKRRLEHLSVQHARIQY
jgi:hypothetical protein